MPLAKRAADLIEDLLKLPAGNLRSTLSRASDLLAEATGADKVDAFLYDASRDSLVAEGISNQPLSIRQRKLGLDVLQISNGGQTVNVFKTGRTLFNRRLDEDTDELRGIKEGLGVRSAIGVPLEVGGERRGVVLIASLRADHFTEEDCRFVESIARWVSVVAHRAELIEQFERDAIEQGRRAGAEEIIGVLAHDMRNFLAPLASRLEWLRLRAHRANQPEELQQIDLARQSLARLRGLVNDMLDVSRIDGGLFQMNAEPVDVGALVTECAGPLAVRGEQVTIRIEAGERIVVPADPNRLRQCMENLITNAINVSPSGAPVTVLVNREPRSKGGFWARIEVLDEGPGVPAEMLPRIFERFATGSPRDGGLGLGLYLAKRIAAMHGGDLTVQSQPGKGTRFILCLPAESEQDVAACSAAGRS